MVEQDDPGDVCDCKTCRIMQDDRLADFEKHVLLMHYGLIPPIFNRDELNSLARLIKDGVAKNTVNK